jgi:Fur family ferric uptake transcriptional regulator
MPRRTAKRVFDAHLEASGRKHTAQREEVVDLFLSEDRHFTPEELHDLLKQRGRRVGQSTVYRTLKLLKECGLAREVKLDDGVTRFEHAYGHDHHDHLVCVCCGKLIEFSEPTMERLQDEIARAHHFTPKHHHMQIYGVCKECRESEVARCESANRRRGSSR